MRGERETALNPRSKLQSDTVPGTPSSASAAVRQTALHFQRMHSNESDKEKDGKQSD